MLPSFTLTPTDTPQAVQTSATNVSPLKKLGRKKKDTPAALVTRPVTQASTPVTVHVKNRFKHTRPSAHVVSAEQQKTKSALESKTIVIAKSLRMVNRLPSKSALN